MLVGLTLCNVNIAAHRKKGWPFLKFVVFLFQMSDPQDFCLRWSSYTQQLSEALRTLLDRELLVDVTLACDGRSLRAHRAILSACSSYFQVCQRLYRLQILILKCVELSMYCFCFPGSFSGKHSSSSHCYSEGC